MLMKSAKMYGLISQRKQTETIIPKVVMVSGDKAAETQKCFFRADVPVASIDTLIKKLKYLEFAYAYVTIKISKSNFGRRERISVFQRQII